MILAANWKMNMTAAEATAFVKAYSAKLVDSKVITIILPPLTAVPAVASACKSSGKSSAVLAYGAQNYYFTQSGAFTGEVSADMLKEHACGYVICGHSERRAIFGESDELVGKKVARAIETGLTPIFCIGETLEEREGGKLEAVLSRQVEKGLSGLTEAQIEKVIVAYEPVWAIGTGVVATPEQAEEAHAYVRSLLRKRMGDACEKVSILYGGSVKPDNVDSLVTQPNIDGALVGGASLKVDSLLALHVGCVKAAG
ncbi:triose-phosphate isomerase [bacterium]|nr:MAG: triose-phosphate isomerase [bacterium]